AARIGGLIRSRGFCRRGRSGGRRRLVREKCVKIVQISAARIGGLIRSRGFCRRGHSGGRRRLV
ncbi:MAG TPA: hypothetical protein DDZ83_06200, partial [Nitrospinae bacterium]|nr:hypothetical protein [Nitrospinota bacterium]